MRFVIPSEEKRALVLGSSNASQILRGKRCAIKVLSSESVDGLLHEYSILKQLNHPNIIRLASSKPFQLIEEQSGKLGLQLELGHIDMFRFLESTQPAKMKTQTIKEIFHSLASALAYLHEEKNLAHNDIKLENIMLFFSKQGSEKTTSMRAKLIDFGLASQREVPSQTILLNWQNRSPNNLSPEILEELSRKQKQEEKRSASNDSENFEQSTTTTEVNFDLSKCDVFQFGLTLFNALFLTNPFTLRDDGSSTYQWFMDKSPEEYWNSEEIQQLLSWLTLDTNANEINLIVDLINRTFTYSTQNRPSMKDILQHPWFTQ